MKVCSLLVIITLVTSTTPFFLKYEHLGFLSPNNNDKQLHLRFRIPRQFPRLAANDSQEIPFLPYLMPLQTQIKEMKEHLISVMSSSNNGSRAPLPPKPSSSSNNNVPPALRPPARFSQNE